MPSKSSLTKDEIFSSRNCNLLGSKSENLKYQNCAVYLKIDRCNSSKASQREYQAAVATKYSRGIFSNKDWHKYELGSRLWTNPPYIHIAKSSLSVISYHHWCAFKVSWFSHFPKPNWIYFFRFVAFFYALWQMKLRKHAIICCHESLSMIGYHW